MSKPITATRRVQFAAGHRVAGHEGKCRHMHGHNYVVLLTAEAYKGDEVLDDIGRVVDFSVLKERIGGWIEGEWDHGFLVDSNDKAVLHALAQLPGQKVAFLPYNPTAENMARYLLHVVGPHRLEGTSVRLVEVTVWETENCYATARL